MSQAACWKYSLTLLPSSRIRRCARKIWMENLALEAKQKAEETLADKQADIDSARALAELAEANARLRMIDKIRKGRA